MRGRMLGLAARRHVSAGSNGNRRHCLCRECAVEKTKGGQRQYERRLWLREMAE